VIATHALRTGLWLSAAAMIAASCNCGSPEPPDIAELTSVLSGEAQRLAVGAAWQTSRAGDRFRGGDAVRTSADGGARLRFLAGGGLRMGPSTTIHFGADALAVQGELEAEGEDTTIVLEMGRARIAAGSRVRVGKDGRAVRFEVLVGSAVVTREQREVEVRAGQAIALDSAGEALEPSGAGDAASDDRKSAKPPAQAARADVPGAISGQVRGAPLRMRPAGVERWSALGPGRHQLSPGTELSVPRGSSIALSAGAGRAVAHGPAELVVAPDGPEGPLVSTRRGRTDVQASEGEVAIRVPGGTIIARRQRGSRADVRVDDDTRVSVTSGVVDVVGQRGARQRLVPGQSAVLDRQGGVRLSDGQPERADFSLRAGLSATIHDPSPPSDVRIRFAELCRGAGVLELAGAREGEWTAVHSRASAIARFRRGAQRYRVRCADGDKLGKAVASGRLTVLADAGTRPLAQTAPHNAVDADGRRYTVLYQNRLPAITFRWPRAPSGGRFRLVVQPRRGRRIELSLASAHRTLDSGALAEGSYQYWFEALGDGRRPVSPRSSLTIDFDNAASSGYLVSPRPEAGWSGESVVVGGGAIEGWRVAVRGTALPLDRQHRFQARVSRARDENGIAVEFRHPIHGVHLYVRRGRKR
jgi:hypothetical protein